MANIPWWGWALIVWALWAIWYWRRPIPGDRPAATEAGGEAGTTPAPKAPAWWQRYLPIKAKAEVQPPRRLDRFQQELLAACGNDQEQANRLIAHEHKKNAALTREDAAESAMERLERERAKAANQKHTAAA